MSEISEVFAYAKGQEDALNGRASAEYLFSATLAHNDYVLGFRAGLAQRETPKKHTRFSKHEQQTDMFEGRRWE